ncbi:nuclear transport factor 2 family protein [Haloarchaeobius sp. TZWWS8]|uniref:nuclear transport factor 2 family protein n=1 Tax=Haloarchaeobius sp. TZWWS8 TaxID=3446121 RepID=UPI003EBAFFBC
MDLAEPVATYYRAIDDGDYEALSDVLASEFVQYRPDRTFEGRESFVQFMREDRPNPDTSHELDATFCGDDGPAVRGRVVDGDEELVRFVDVFVLEDGQVQELETYTR